MPDRAFLLFSLVLTLALTGCGDREIRVYQVPKEAPSALAAETAAGNAAPALSQQGAGQLTWTAPAHWREGPASATRLGSYSIPGATQAASGDLSITAFPGDTGGLVANVNRWRGQIGLPPAAPEEVEASVSHLDVNGLHLDWVDLAGNAPPTGSAPRILAAIVPHGGSTWFFKLSGPADLLESERENFLQFLQTVQAK